MSIGISLGYKVRVTDGYGKVYETFWQMHDDWDDTSVWHNWGNWDGIGGNKQCKDRYKSGLVIEVPHQNSDVYIDFAFEDGTWKRQRFYVTYNADTQEYNVAMMAGGALSNSTYNLGAIKDAVGATGRENTIKLIAIIERSYGDNYPLFHIKGQEYNRTVNGVTTWTRGNLPCDLSYAKNHEQSSLQGFPYGDGESTSQGGQGEMIDTSDPIEIDSKPLLTTGDFLRVYKLTATDLTALQNKLISNGFLDDLIPKLRTDAMDYIVGLNAIPINTTNVAASTIKIANLDTGINASYLSWYIEDIDFGEIALTEYFQTFMDYSPYTKLSVYIPYCGIVPLNVDNFMNDKISMKCRVDMLTGQFVVFVSNSTGIVTTVSGSCAYQLPIRANDYNRLVTSGLGLLGGIVGTAGALATGNIPLAVGAGIGTVGGLVATSQAMTKPDVTSKGSLGGNYGLLGNRTPYLIIQRPTLSVPPDYGKTIGYMSRITSKLGDLSGYTVVEEIHLEHISATDDEKKLIENALKSGVIL